MYLMIEHAVRRTVGPAFEIRSDLAALALALGTFVVVSMTWIFFRAPNSEVAGALLRTLFVEPGAETVTLAERAPLAVATLAGLVAWHWVSRAKPLADHFARWPAAVRVGAIATAMLGILWSSGGEKDAFIYFQF